METWTRWFARRLEAPGWARQFVSDVLRGRIPEDDLSSVLTMTSELTTNTVLHPERGEWLGVFIDERARRLIVRVRDSGSGFRPSHLREASEEWGLGLTLVDALASRWGADPSPNGTEVWFELDTVPLLARRGVHDVARHHMARRAVSEFTT